MNKILALRARNTTLEHRYNLDTRRWEQAAAPKIQPSARWMHSTVVDEKESKAHGAVIFGGCNNTLQLLNDVWTYKWPSTWSLLWPQSAEDAAKGPSPREGHAAAMGTASFSETKAAKEMYVFCFCFQNYSHRQFFYTEVQLFRLVPKNKIMEYHYLKKEHINYFEHFLMLEDHNRWS